MKIKDVVRDFGFDSEMEYHRLVANVPLNSAEDLDSFQDWKIKDGSKEGLLKLY